MKNLKSFLLLAVFTMFTFGILYAQSNKTNPDNAKYFIKGDLSIDGDSYKLSNISSHGISFDNPGAYIIGTETEKEDVRFTFSHYDTDYPGGKDTRLQFWRYLYGEWVPDGETRQGSREMSEKKSMIVMLVLDCSSSMSSDINSIKQAAKNLVNTLYNASGNPNGNSNIKIGYVTFSTVGNTYVSDIKPLTQSTKSQIESAINSISTSNGTALYYAMDKAVEKIEAYCNSTNFSNEPLSSVTMLTFTDGLDQGSIDKSKGIRDGQSYYNYFVDKYKEKHINGLPLCSNIIGVRGNDIISDNQWNNFMSIGRSLSEDINSCGSFKTCNISRLAQEFQNFAENLVNQWKVLNLYVPNAFQGPVAWTFFTNNETPVYTPKPTPTPTPTKRVNFTHGIEFGGIFGSDYSTLFGGFELGYDFGVKIGKHCIGLNIGLNYSLGTYTEINEHYSYYGSYWQDYNEYTYSAIGFSMIPHYMHYNNYGNAFIVGAGYTMVFDEFAGVFRLGFKSMGRFYMTFDLIAGGVIAGKVNFGIMIVK